DGGTARSVEGGRSVCAVGSRLPCGAVEVHVGGQRGRSSSHGRSARGVTGGTRGAVVGRGQGGVEGRAGDRPGTRRSRTNTRASGLCDLYLRVNREAEGSDDIASRRLWPDPSSNKAFHN